MDRDVDYRRLEAISPVDRRCRPPTPSDREEPSKAFSSSVARKSTVESAGRTTEEHRPFRTDPPKTNSRVRLTTTYSSPLENVSPRSGRSVTAPSCSELMEERGAVRRCRPHRRDDRPRGSVLPLRLEHHVLGNPARHLAGVGSCRDRSPQDLPWLSTRTACSEGGHVQEAVCWFCSGAPPNRPVIQFKELPEEIPSLPKKTTPPPSVSARTDGFRSARSSTRTTTS